MSKTFFSNFALIGENLELKENIYIKISEEGLIREITKQPIHDSNIVTFKNALIVPGFINTHVHIGDSFAKDKGINLTLSEVVEPPNGLKHRLLKETKKEIIIEGIKNGIREMICSGTTTFVDFRESGIEGILVLKEALKDFLIRPIILGRPFPDLSILTDLLKISDGIGLSSSNLYDDKELEIISLLSIEDLKIISTHVSETQSERDLAFNKFQISDIERSVKFLKANLLVHAIYADANDIDLISKNNIPIVICPRANAYFGLKFPPIASFLKNGISLCLGTDNVMANSPDLFREMDFLLKLIRGMEGIRVLTSKDILLMVTINPSKAMGLDHLIGSLEPGKYADFFVLDLNAPNLVPIKNIYDSIVLRAKSENIISTFIRGKLAFERK